jgi:hypothetical protein
LRLRPAPVRELTQVTLVRRDPPALALDQFLEFVLGRNLGVGLHVPGPAADLARLLVVADDFQPESTLKVYSRKDDEITLPPIETKRHSPRTFHASRIVIQGGVLVEITCRIAKRRR